MDDRGEPTLRSALLAVFGAGLNAVRGDRAVDRALRAGFGRDGVEVEALAAGKAALPMLRAAASSLGERLVRGLAVTKAPGLQAPPRCEVLFAGHPVPDARSLRAGQRWLRHVETCPTNRDLLVLLSGGGSALLSCPAPGLELEDVQRVTELMLRAGADIEALNAVRKHLGAVGGGRSLEASQSGWIEVLAISDVPEDRLDLIASGPFCADGHRYVDAVAALEALSLRASVPPRVWEHLRAGVRGERPETLKAGDPSLGRVRHRIVASLPNAIEAAAAAARAQGLEPQIRRERLCGEAREEAKRLARAARAAPPRSCLIAGGEPVVTVRGPGQGGRAQELALALAIELEGDAPFCALVAGTDGNDGPTDAAGAWADGGTVARGQAAGVDAREALETNDSFRFFSAEGGLLRTGATSTNVNDLVLVGTP